MILLKVSECKFLVSVVFMNIEQRFLQSPEWEQFQQSLGKETFRVGKSLFIAYKLPIVGKYIYSPRGPRILEQQDISEWQTIKNGEQKIQEIIQEAKKRGCSWVRVEPSSEEEFQCMSNFLATGHLPLVSALKDVQPREILVMDITKSEEEMLSQMKSKTRYNIRLAEKKGIKIVVSKEQKYRDRFFDLVQETSVRAGIRSHPKEHYEKMLDTLGDTAQLYNATYEEEVIASNMMIFFGDVAIYLHGGSSNKYRNVMAPFLLQWKAMRDAKRKGYMWYDFGGVSFSNKNWRGITKFKQGFCLGMKSLDYPGTFDIVLDPLRYGLYKIISNIRKIV